MPFIDLSASAVVRSERELRGLSPEALAREISAMASRAGWKLGAVDAYTIRRIEGNPSLGRPGFVPSIRVQCVLGLFFGVPHQEIWRTDRRVFVPSPPRVKVAA